MFRQNGGCGFVKKPEWMLSGDAPPSRDPRNLRVHVYSASKAYTLSTLARCMCCKVGACVCGRLGVVVRGCVWAAGGGGLRSLGPPRPAPGPLPPSLA
eukprot:228899-Chlamydomonas_euryale.AAC.1